MRTYYIPRSESKIINAWNKAVEELREKNRDQVLQKQLSNLTLINVDAEGEDDTQDLRDYLADKRMDSDNDFDL